MTAEDRLRMKIGEYVMTIAFLEAQLAAKDDEIAALKVPIVPPIVEPPA